MDVYSDYIAEREWSNPVIKNLGIFDVNIYREQALEDLSVLEYVLTSIYSGKDWLKKTGINIPEKLDGVKSQIMSAAYVNKGAFFDMICQALQDIKDSHLVFNLPYFNRVHAFCAHNTAYFADIVLEERNGRFIVVQSHDKAITCGDVICPAREQLFPSVNRRYLFGALSRSPISRISCRCNNEIKQVQVLPVKEKPAGRSAIWSHAQKGDVDIVTLNRLTDFGAQEEGEMAAFMEMGKKLKNAAKIILDIRGNGGGNFQYAQSFIENLNGSAVFNGNYAKLDTQGSRLAEISLSASDKGAYDRAKTEILSNPVSAWHCADKQEMGEGTYKNEFIVLMDRNTASSAEITIKCLKDNMPQCVLIGENTKGELNTGDIRYFYLPHSLIFLNIPTAIFAGIFEEGTGFIPDFWSKGDAMQTAMDFLAGR